jgi:hypothetical protein
MAVLKTMKWNSSSELTWIKRYDSAFDIIVVNIHAGSYLKKVVFGSTFGLH